MGATDDSGADRQWQEKDYRHLLADFVRRAMSSSMTGELTSPGEALQNFLYIFSQAERLRTYPVIEYVTQELRLGNPTPQADEFDGTPERLFHKVLKALRVYLEKTADDSF